jgi:hypothetical protein
LESSDAYRALQSSLNKDTTEKEMDAKRALLILETQEKDAEGNNVYSLVPKLFFLHTWLVHLVDKGVSDI